MISEFVSWYEFNARQFKESSTHTNLKLSDSPDLDKAGIEFETEFILATITIWGWGDVEVIAMDKQTKKVVLVEDLRIQSPLEVFPALDRYFDRIASDHLASNHPL
jgi:hypothetical protein